MNEWRFYHHFPTGPDAPARNPQPAVLTPALANDGSDLAAALQTIIEIGDADALHNAVDTAISGASVEIGVDDHRRMVVELRVPSIRRSFQARELSDGTLRFLYLAAALLSPRPPAMIALNEPETSLHPDVIDPLAKLIVAASKESQMWIVTHSEPLAQLVEEHSRFKPLRLQMVEGQTRFAGSNSCWQSLEKDVVNED